MSLKIAKVVTTVIMVTSIAIWICWDIVVAALGLFPATESQILLAFGTVNFVFPAALGALLGHLFWPVEGEIKYQLVRVLSLAVYISVVLSLNIMHVFPEMIPIIPLVLHIPVGHLLWPQQREKVA